MKPLIPAPALEQHIAVLGKTGSGKTFAAKASIIEPVLAAGRRVGIVDPTDAWWGLRSSRDGKGAGFPVLVLGGDHGDLPLPANGGAAVARLLIEQRVNLVACTKRLTVGERTRWFIDFAGTINRINKSPLHLVLDEAHNFAPQGKVPDPDTGKMLHAANALASEGRSKGIRLTMITQRPQKLHKDTLTCAETLIAMRVLAPHDRLAVEDWIKGCGDMAAGKEVLNSLASLQKGEGWVWYPEGGHLARVKFPQIKTFDSSATPTEGHELEAPKGAAEIDLTEIRTAMAEAVKEAEANDPKLLRAELSKVRADLAKALKNHAGDLTADPKVIAAAEDRGRAAGWNAALTAMQPIADRFGTLSDAVWEAASGFQTDLKRQQKAAPPAPLPSRSQARVDRPVFPPEGSRARGNGGAAPSGEALTKAERLILTALAQYQDGRSRVQVAVLTCYAADGGGFKNALGALRTAGRIDGTGDCLVITDAGRTALGDFTPLPHGDALLQHWYRQLGKAERKALESLVEVYPRTLSKAQLASLSGYDEDGGGFKNALGRLRTLELVKGKAEIKASEDLFDG